VIENYRFKTGTRPEVKASITTNGYVTQDKVPRGVRAICNNLPGVESVIIIRNTDTGQYIHVYQPLQEAPASRETAAAPVQPPGS
jgi:hypothetical protein